MEVLVLISQPLVVLEYLLSKLGPAPVCSFPRFAAVGNLGSVFILTRYLCPQPRCPYKPSRSSSIIQSTSNILLCFTLERDEIPQIIIHPRKSLTMSSSHQGSAQQGRKGESSKSGKEPAKSLSEEWAEIKDPNERRRVQNKLAQRRFRESSPLATLIREA